jgi:hypothetical protein
MHAKIVKEDCTEDVGVEAATRYPKRAVGVVEFVELEMVRNNLLDGYRPRDLAVAHLCVLGQQGRRIGLNLLIGEVGNKIGHLISILT